ncbi:hypothetical protein G3N95_18660 [Paraburkholderia sp. Tr-20389]|uniref:hypothetical protein n=1 Tax=Paraburkholderia sp. Tr-20389 TaxID=2703903 RepID=UPI001980ABD7|nr:hypothetical protein [Paraburkholderia sp. Tr-20389]MBN3754976.1 hypothetical protein [Paraburkholderia sp. Tr-20389]
MNVFPPEPPPEPRQTQPYGEPLGETENSLTLMLIANAEQMCKAQDKRIASDLASYAQNRSSHGRTLDLLRLQYDLDDMQTSAMLAKNIADKVGQAITQLTQRN